MYGGIRRFRHQFSNWRTIMRKTFHSIIIPIIGFLILISGCVRDTPVAPVTGSNDKLMKWAVIDSSGDQQLAFSIGPRYFTPNPSTGISFDMPTDGIVTLVVYDERSIIAAKLIDHVLIDSGQNEVQFNASNISSGIYLYVLKIQSPSPAGDGAVIYKAARKMMLIK
jgi:hypothetical protein